MNKQEILDALNEGKSLTNDMFAISLQDAYYYEDFDDTMEVLFRNPESWKVYDE